MECGTYKENIGNAFKAKNERNINFRNGDNNSQIRQKQASGRDWFSLIHRAQMICIKYIAEVHLKV